MSFSRTIDKAIRVFDKSIPYKNHYIEVNEKGYAKILGNDFKGKTFASLEQAKKEIDRLKK